MAYDFDKYREKRERVLGVKKRGLGFGLVATAVSLVILLGLGMVVIPRSIAFLQNRQLEDAIYKLSGEHTDAQQALAELKKQDGVREVVVDSHGSRVVVTFNKEVLDTAKISAFLLKQGAQAVLLNEVGHSQRLHTMKKEAVATGGL
ncbi:MAG: LMBR1 domain-containing protein [Desulfurivibrio sp.]|nr:LMBR1 domain-containing protein [Desulfurivibrio sp.]MBU4033459.1 LMBR1 domain-containing protein [Pseudomonadota bacterium]MBU4119383.1 LMBR1 domain-containing protein [Pseudomonadota bacterium]